MRRVTLTLVLGVILVIILLFISFFYVALARPANKKQDIVNPYNSSQSQLEVNEQYVSYILNEMGAYQLRSNSIIEIDVEGKNFTSYIDKGNIRTLPGKSDEEDIRIITSKEEVKNALSSVNVKEYLKGSVASGKTSIEMVAGYTKLLSKGYLYLYQDITGKSFTGSFIRIFSS
jgi:hypothetical protein